jgi:hypothetical protein
VQVQHLTPGGGDERNSPGRPDEELGPAQLEIRVPFTLVSAGIRPTDW